MLGLAVGFSGDLGGDFACIFYGCFCKLFEGIFCVIFLFVLMGV